MLSCRGFHSAMVVFLISVGARTPEKGNMPPPPKRKRGSQENRRGRQAVRRTGR